MATQRQINRMDYHERQQLLHTLAEELNGALNLFGADKSPISDLLAATDDREITRLIHDLLTPTCSCRRGCDHDFPPWFVREARPAAMAFLRAWRQVDNAP